MYRSDQETGLVSDQIRALYHDFNGSLWIGTSSGGLSRLDSGTGEFSHYRNVPGDRSSLSSNAVTTILEDEAGSLWVGTPNAGLNRLDRATGRFTRFDWDPADSTSLSTPVVTTLHVGPSGNLWVGARGDGSTRRTGVQRFNPGTGDFSHFARTPHAANDMAVFTIAPADDGGLWLGTNLGGLQHLDPVSGLVTPAHMGIPEFAGPIATLYRSPAEVLWVGTAGRGLGYYQPETGQGEMFVPGSGGLNDNIRSLLEDADGTIWIGTLRGLGRYDPQSEAFRTFDALDGLPTTSFNGEAASAGPEGALFFGTEKGLVEYLPGRENPHPPELALTGFSLFGEPVSPGPGSPLQGTISQAESVTLRHDENDFSIGFAALHYSAPQKNRYAYKLEPYEDSWRDAGAQRSATYMNLAPGSYTFRVRAANNDGVWNEEGISFRVEVRPPWWRTMWAYLAYGVMGIGGLLVVDRVQRRRLLRAERERANMREAELKAEAAQAQAKVLEELDQAKSRFFANVSHELRTPLTLILGPIRDMLDGSMGDIPKPITRQHRLIKRSADRLLRLVNQLLDLARLEAGSMAIRARRGNLAGLLRRVAGIFSSRAERRGVTLTVDVGEALDLWFEDDKLEKVFTNLLSNAFKFTPDGGVISVEASAQDSTVQVVVSDSGEGIPAADLPFIFDRFRQVDSSSTRKHQGTGIGLALVRELVAVHGGTISVASEVGVGTRFTVRLPQGTEHLADAELIEEAAELAEGPTPLPTEDLDEQMAAVLDGPENAPLVLVVEDHADVRTYLRDHLATQYRVMEAVDGVDGLEKARATPPALVVSDVMMPRMDGYALCEAVKQDAALADVPVILLTAKADEESKVEGLETGADDYMFKPFSAAELLVRAENLIQIRRLLRERFSGQVVLEPSGLAVASDDAAFLERVRDVVDERMADRNFGVEWLADEMNVSTRQLQRRLKATMDLSPSGYIRTMRLNRAAQLLERGVGNISEIAGAVGFQDTKHFSTLFRQVFGTPPSKYVSEKA